MVYERDQARCVLLLLIKCVHAHGVEFFLARLDFVLVLPDSLVGICKCLLRLVELRHKRFGESPDVVSNLSFLIANPDAVGIYLLELNGNSVSLVV